MNIRELTYFLTVIDTGNFTDAADMCCVTQPTLSAGIKKLEDELDTQLIIRGTKNTGGVRPTIAGLKIAHIARDLQAQAAKIKKIAHDMKNPFIGDLRIGAFPTLCPYLIPKILPQLKEKFSQMRFFIHEEKSENLMQMLHNDEIDVIFLATPHKDFISPSCQHHYISQKVFFDPFFLATPKDHALNEFNHISIDDIAPKELLLLEEGHCLRDQALEFCQMSTREQIDFRGSSLETLLAMVKMGTGYTLVPKIALEMHRTDMNFTPMADPTIGRDIYMIFNKKMLSPKIIEKFNLEF